MQKTRFVKDLKEGEPVRGLCLVANRALLTSNAGKPYLTLQLRGRTGQIEGRVWDRAEEIGKRFDRDEGVEGSGSAIAYQGRVQLKVHDVRRGGGVWRCRCRRRRGGGCPAGRGGGGLRGAGGRVPGLPSGGAFDYTDEGRLL